jgi:hypothetical protein
MIIFLADFSHYCSQRTRELRTPYDSAIFQQYLWTWQHCAGVL